MQSVTPCLWFDDQALEAAEHYVSVFPGSRITGTVPYAEGTPGVAGSIMLVSFEIGGVGFQALNGGPLFTFSEAVSFVVPVDTQEEIDHLWSALTADGGEPGQCGWLKDRFGVSWQIVPTGLDELAQQPERFARAMQAVMGMTKIDIAAMEAAADARATV